MMCIALNATFAIVGQVFCYVLQQKFLRLPIGEPQLSSQKTCDIDTVVRLKNEHWDSTNMNKDIHWM